MQLATGVIDGELPGDGGPLLVAGVLPGADLGGEGVAVANASAEALAGSIEISNSAMLSQLPWTGV